MKHNLWMKLILSALWILLVAALYIWVAIRIWSVPDIPEVIICEQRYIWDKYWWEVKARDWDYIYLDWYKSIDVICTPYEDMVDEETPLCWTQVIFEWPLDTSNMNCYASEDDFKWKLKAFKKQEEDAKEDEKKYYTCDIDSSYIIKLYNDCETVACAQNRLRTYFQEKCPRANVD